MSGERQAGVVTSKRRRTILQTPFFEYGHRASGGIGYKRCNARTSAGLMAGFRRWLKAAAAVMMVAIVAVMVLEMEVFYSYGSSGTRLRLQRSDDIMINPAARLPNEGRLKKKKNGGKSRCARNKQTLV